MALGLLFTGPEGWGRRAPSGTSQVQSSPAPAGLLYPPAICLISWEREGRLPQAFISEILKPLSHPSGCQQISDRWVLPSSAGHDAASRKPEASTAGNFPSQFLLQDRPPLSNVRSSTRSITLDPVSSLGLKSSFLKSLPADTCPLLIRSKVLCGLFLQMCLILFPVVWHLYSFQHILSNGSQATDIFGQVSLLL